MNYEMVKDEAKSLVSLLPAEFSLIEFDLVLVDVFRKGWTNVGFLEALIASADKVFPDPRTRPIAVGFLAIWARFAGIPHAAQGG